MIFSQHLQLIPNKIQEALSIDNNYKKMQLLQTSRLFIVGSGSSYSHGIFLRDCLQEIVTNQIQLLNPYTFVRYSKPNKND